MSYYNQYDRPQKGFLSDAATGAIYGLGIGALTGNIGRGAAIGAAAGGLLGPSVGRGIGLPGFGGGSRRRRRHSRRRSYRRMRGGLVTLENPVPLEAGRRRRSRSRRRMRGGMSPVAADPAVVTALDELAAQLDAEAALQGGRRRRSRSRRRSRRSRRIRGGEVDVPHDTDLQGGKKRRRRRSSRRRR